MRRCLGFIAIFLCLSGCGFKASFDVTVHQAAFYTPHGEFGFERRKKYDQTYFDSNDMVSLRLFPLRDRSYLNISRLGVERQYKVATVDSGAAFYQLNGGEKKPLTVVVREKGKPNGFDIIAPDTMEYYSKDGDGAHVTEGRRDANRADKQKVREEVYRYYIPFSADNEDYAIDITFQLEINSSLTWLDIGPPTP